MGNRTMVRFVDEDSTMNRTMVRIFAETMSDSCPPAYDADMELPQVEGARAPRVDAIRNREAILEAAARLLRDRGADAITMDCLANEAGVGKGTLFRRFGDRAGLFHALLDESERRLQEGFIRGPAPLGPGAPPADRLVAFGEALLDLTAERGDLLLAALPPEHGLRYRSPVYGAYRAHINALLDQAAIQHSDYVADVLLAALDPELIMHQLGRGIALGECKDSWAALVRTVVRR
jgi:AcrR family transcriptional regulator